jgi:hypothetical protein
MRTIKGNPGIIRRCRQENKDAPPPSAKLGLPAVRNMVLTNPAEDKRSGQKLRLS